MTEELDWQPIETAPWQQVVWVRNKLMEKPVKATRGYSYNGMVHPNDTFFTTAFTPDEFFPTPAGNLVCPDEWSPDFSEKRDPEISEPKPDPKTPPPAAAEMGDGKVRETDEKT